MATSMIYTGLGLATAGFTGRFIARTFPAITNRVQQHLKHLPNPSVLRMNTLLQAWNNAKYHRGGFEGKMTKTEAYRILGISSNSSQKIVNAQHKKIMLLNHPDRGGSPYLAAKINEAKDMVTRRY